MGENEVAVLPFLDGPVARNHIAQTLAQQASGGFSFTSLADAAIRAVREVAELAAAQPGHHDDAAQGARNVPETCIEAPRSDERGPRCVPGRLEGGQ